MGNTVQTATPQLSPEQRDLKFLGDRMPFGDDDLKRMYSIYQLECAKRKKSQETAASSFVLTEWSSLILRYSTQQQETPSRFEQWIQIVEERILPPGFVSRFLETAFSLGGETNDETLRLERMESFVNGFSVSLGRRGSNAVLKLLARSIGEADNEQGVQVQPLEFIVLGYRIALACAFLETALKTEAESDDEENEENEISNANRMAAYIPVEESSKSSSTLEALAASIVGKAKRRLQRQGKFVDEDAKLEFVDQDVVLEWAETHAPVFPWCLPTLMHYVLFPDKSLSTTRTSLQFPRILQESTFFTTPSSPLLFGFACMSSALNGEYYRLYTSASDGLSFNRLQNALLGYGGPTLLLIETSEGAVLGAFTASPWKESKDFYGNTDCFLYRFQPSPLCVYRPTGNARNFMYCNSFARSRGYDQQAHGIGFGGTTDQPRLFLSESFDDCHALIQDLTFEKGPLLTSTTMHAQTSFQIELLEVWGVGGDQVVQQALGARTQQRAIKDANIKKARKVDKAAFLDDFRSGLIESKAFKHREEIRGRASACVDEDHKNAYVYEK